MKPGKILVGASLCALIGALQGCVPLLVAGVAAGAAAGTVSYVSNELRVVHEVTVDRAWDAGQAAMKELQFIVLSSESRKDATGGIIRGRNAKDQPVSIQLIRQTDKMTEIRVRVGTMNTAANRDVAQLLYNTMKSRL
jgi:hypothetical protein